MEPRLLLPPLTPLRDPPPPLVLLLLLLTMLPDLTFRLLPPFTMLPFLGPGFDSTSWQSSNLRGR